MRLCTMVSPFMLFFITIIITPLLSNANSSFISNEEREILFEQIGVEDGLSNNSVWGITQDSQGFLWFGSFNGLHRYDGINFRIFKTNPDETDSLSGNGVRVLYEDTSNRLWVGTWNDGLNLYNRHLEKFVRYQYDPEDPYSISGNAIRSILEDSKGRLWIGTDKGFNRFDVENNRFIRFQHDSENGTSLSNNDVFSIYEDSNGMLWIGTYGGGLNCFDPETNSFYHYLYDKNDPLSLSTNFVYTPIHEDNVGNLWIGTWGSGLNKFDPETGIFTRYQHQPDNPGTLSNNIVASIIEGPDGFLWIGTWGGGLNIFNPETEQFTGYIHDVSDSTSISSNFVVNLYEDREGLIWIGTEEGGINKINPYHTNIKKILHDPFDDNSLSGNSIYSIHEDRSGVLWFGTRNNGLCRFDPETSRFTHYKHDPGDPDSIAGSFIADIHEDRSGKLWLALYGSGLDCFDPDTGRFTHYKSDVDNPFSFTHNEVYRITGAHDGKLWLGINSGGLNLFDPETGHVIRYSHDPEDSNSISNNNIFALCTQDDGLLWIGTKNGLDLLDPETGIIKHYYHDDDNHDSISSNNINCIHVDRSGILWVGTATGGLNKFDRKTGKFKHFHDRDGLQSNTITDIEEDDNGFLWLTTNEGIVKFDPATEKVTNYDENIGFKKQRYHIVKKLHDNLLMFGSNHGIESVYPDDLVENPYIPPVIITDFQLDNTAVSIGADLILKKSITETDHIQLSYNDRVISFEIASLSYMVPEKNLYRYKLVGFDDEWYEVDSTRRIITYTNLDPGEYELVISGSNNDGIWNEKGRSISITVTPPWWGTIYFRLTVIILIISVILGVFYWQKKASGIRENRLAELVHERTTELQDAKEAIIKEKLISDTLIDSLPGLFYLTDQNGRFIKNNRNFEIVTGYTNEELSEIAGTELFGDNQSLAIEKMQEVLTNDKAQVEIDLVTRSGKKIPYLFLASKIELDGKVCIIGTGSDLTELRKATHEVSRLSEKYRALFEQAGDGILLGDATTREILDFNDETCNSLGYTREEFQHIDISHIDVNEFPEKVEEHQRKVIKNGFDIFETRLKKKNGEIIDVLVNTSIISIGGRKYLQSIWRNITTLKKMEKELRAAKEVAELSARSKSTFLANMSHEIRTPMNSVIGFIELAINGDTLSETTINYLETALSSARSLLSVINDILDVSKLDAGKLKIESRKFYLPRLLKNTMQALSIAIQEKCLDFFLDISPDLHHCIISDSNRLRQVLINLVSNAIKFTHHGSITVSVIDLHTGFLQFSVSDTGIGMSPEQLTKVFNPFSQADDSTARKYGGTGLGTTICKQLVKLMGGEIRVESEIGVGSTFYFTIAKRTPDCFDRCYPGCKEHGDIYQESLSDLTRSFKILIAEDIEENASLAKIRLENQSHEITIRSNGKEVIEAYKEESFDIILMDVHMPELDGLEATRQIRAIEKKQGNQRIPIIALTASVMEEEQKKCLDAGMDEVVGKPVQFNELCIIMEQIVPENKGKLVTDYSNKQSGKQIEEMNLMITIDGVNVEKGLKTWRNEDVYFRALKVFSQKYALSADKIDQLLCEENIDEAFLLAHSLKGVTANLFIEGVSEYMKQVEKALKVVDVDEVKRLLPELKEQLRTTVNAINTLNKKEAMPVTKDREFEYEKVKDLIDELLSSFSRGESNEELLTALIESLQRHIEGDVFEKLRNLIESYNFDDAKLILKFIMNLYNM